MSTVAIIIISSKLKLILGEIVLTSNMEEVVGRVTAIMDPVTSLEQMFMKIKTPKNPCKYF